MIDPNFHSRGTVPPHGEREPARHREVRPITLGVPVGVGAPGTGPRPGFASGGEHGHSGDAERVTEITSWGVLYYAFPVSGGYQNLFLVLAGCTAAAAALTIGSVPTRHHPT